jgi:hypothetical protein
MPYFAAQKTGQILFLGEMGDFGGPPKLERKRHWLQRGQVQLLVALTLAR